MEPLALFTLMLGVSLVAIFNYLLNWAPGSEPEDYQIGPRELGLRCDCSMNAVVLGAISVLVLSVSSSRFSSREELFMTGVLSFFIVTLAGVMGRRRRYNEWKTMRGVFERVLPPHMPQNMDTSVLEIEFDDEDDDDEDSYEYYDE
ncbi:MAG: hypothetical protein HXY34_03725 [Candidatus Thorarchaeota archaeon]|nr:hypothetical protein [Candidatus Thorarchaeota archaeon]